MPSLGTQRDRRHQRGHRHEDRDEHRGRGQHLPPGHQVRGKRRDGHGSHRDPADDQRPGQLSRRPATPPAPRTQGRPEGEAHGQPGRHLRAHRSQGRSPCLEPDEVIDPLTGRRGSRDHGHGPPADRCVLDPDPLEGRGREVLELDGAGLPRRARGQQALAERRTARHDRPRSHAGVTVAEPGHDDVGPGCRPDDLGDERVEARHGIRPLGLGDRQRSPVDEHHGALDAGRHRVGVRRPHRSVRVGGTDRRTRPAALHARPGCRDRLGEQPRSGVVGIRSGSGQVVGPVRHDPTDRGQRLAARPGQVPRASPGREGEPAVDGAGAAAHRPHGQRPGGALLDERREGRQVVALEVGPGEPGRADDDEWRGV